MLKRCLFTQSYRRQTTRRHHSVFDNAIEKHPRITQIQENDDVRHSGRAWKREYARHFPWKTCHEHNLDALQRKKNLLQGVVPRSFF